MIDTVPRPHCECGVLGVGQEDMRRERGLTSDIPSVAASQRHPHRVVVDGKKKLIGAAQRSV
jgi:hypothetical protein